MTAPRGTDTGSSDETTAMPQRAPAGKDATEAPRSGTPQDTSPQEPEAIPRAGGSRSSAVPQGPGWSQSPPPAQESASSRTTVLPTGSTGRPAPRPARSTRTDARPATGARPLTGRTRRARLSLRRVDPWSVFLFSLVASIFLGVALVVAVAVLYTVLGSLGVTDSINQLFAEVTGGDVANDALLTSGRIVGGAAVLAAVNVVFLTLLATLASLLYNLCASFTGGLELTFGERD